MTEPRLRDHERWVQLTLRPVGPDLVVDYADELGLRTSAGPLLAVSTGIAGGVGPAHVMSLLSERFPRLLIPAELASWLREGFADRTEIRGHLLPKKGDSEQWTSVPWLLPVFVLAPAGRSHPLGWPWEAWLERLLFAPSDDLSTRCVLIRARTLPPAQPLRLPLLVGDVASPDGRLLAGVRSRSWLAKNRRMRSYGLRLLPRDETTLRGADLIVKKLGPRLPSGLKGKRKRSPKLVVSLARGEPWRYTKGQRRLKRGVSHLLVMHRHQGPPTWQEDVVTNLVYALVHDFALHEIAWIIRNTLPGVDTLLVTSVAANQSLRLSSVMRHMVDDARARRPDWRHELNRLVTDFTRESHGLTSMAEFLANDESVGLHDARAAPQGPVDQPPEPRRVDMSVDYYDAFGVLRPMVEYGTWQRMQRGWRYRLRVHIGSRDWETSAMAGDVQPIDQLLPEAPDDTPRPLDVVIFEKRFGRLSDHTQTIWLPRTGGTAPVYFELRAPQEAGPADLRIVLYHEGNLVQSFVLEADIVPDAGLASSAGPEGPRPPTIRLASGGPGNLETAQQFRPRALSVALNHDAGAGTHTVMVKGDHRWRREVHLRGDEMTSIMDEFHKILGNACSDTPAPFEQSLRKLAALGRRIWDMLMAGKSDQTSNVLRDLRGSTGKTLQFLRHGSGRPFPWQTVYDYLPPEGNGFLNATICFADAPAKRPLAPGVKGCPHHPGEDVICIEGFWSARHRIELLSEDGTETTPVTNRAIHATAPLPNPLVLLGVGTSDLAADEFVQHLEAMLASEQATIQSTDAPVAELLWNPDRRPALLILLAHLQPADPDHYLPLRMHAFLPEAEGSAISPRLLFDYQLHGRWTDPRQPLVLLLACQSAHHHVGELTNLMDAFLAAGAAGVAGTECELMSSTAADFARHIIKDTLVATPRLPLGETLQRFVYASLRESSIWPFVFTVYGNADMTIGRPET